MRHIIGTATILALAASTANAAPWQEDQAFFTEDALRASNELDAADLDGDGFIDLVFANGEGFEYAEVNSAQAQQAFLNEAGAKMKDVSAVIFKGQAYNGRVVKLRDIDHDGDNDIVLGTTWQTQSQLLLNDGAGNFSNETASHFPQINASIGDLELGDVDGDGDLDLMLADWGPGSSASGGPGGITQLWRQMDSPGRGEPGTAMFEDVTFSQMPLVNVTFSVDAELVDIDNDFDLDILVSAYAGVSASLFLFTNDGTGTFTDVTAAELDPGTYALELEAMDLDGDAFLDLVTLNDGPEGRNRVLINNTDGGFSDLTNTVWPLVNNPPNMDATAVFYDHDSDRKVDLVLATIGASPDRLMLNQAGKLKPWGEDQDPKYQAFGELPPSSSGTLAIVLADFNKDLRLDVAMSQTEVAFEKKVLLATAEIPVDTAPPIFVNHEQLEALQYPGTATLRVRCHDNKSPLMLHDFNQDQGLPYLESWTEGPVPDPDANPGTRSDPGRWYGEYLWRIDIEVPDAAALFYRLCAIDAAGNKACTAVLEAPIMADTDSSEPTAGTSSSTTDPTQGGNETIGATAASDSNSADGAPTDTFVSASESTVTASSADTVDGMGPLVDPAGCVCNSADDRPARSTVRAGLAWLLLPLLLRRRHRSTHRRRAAGSTPRQR